MDQGRPTLRADQRQLVPPEAPMLRKIREWLCRHDFQTTPYQALVPGIGQQCTKCGKQRRIY